VSAAADRAVYAAVYWARRRDGAAIRQVFDGLSDTDQVEVAWLLSHCDLDGLADDELRLRMLGLAGEAPSPGIF
jgi:hypothetical protein